MFNKNYKQNEYKEIVGVIEKRNRFFHDLTLSKQSNEEDVSTYTLDIPQISISNQQKLEWYDSFVRVVLLAKNSGLIDSAIVHGSFGDFTYTEFSDLEVTLLLSKDVLSRQDKITQLQEWLKNSFNPLILQIDPLQHHGPFYLWPELLEAYSEKLLPLDAYKGSWSLEPISLNFGVLNDEQSYDMRSFQVTLNSIRNYDKAFFKYGMSPYSIKRLLSNIMLLPAFYFQGKGKKISKRDAINNILEIGVEPIITVILLATDYRNEWKKPPAWLGRFRAKISSEKIPSSRFDLIVTSFYRDANLNKSIKSELLPKLNDFCLSFERLAEIHDV